MSKLADILEQEMQAEVDSLLDKADSTAAALIAEARKKAEARLAAHRRRTEADFKTGLRRAESAAELAVATARTRAREEMIALVREKALRALEQACTGADYGAILQGLAEEALHALGTAKVAELHREDAPRLKDWAGRKGLELRDAPDLRFGVRLTGRDGGRSVENTLYQRLDRSWPALASEAAKILWQ